MKADIRSGMSIPHKKAPQGGLFIFMAGGEGLTRSKLLLANLRLRRRVGRTGFCIQPSPIYKNKKAPQGGLFIFMAGGEGFEPPLAESESAVLPLDDPPIALQIFNSSPIPGEGWIRAFGPHPPGKIALLFCLSARCACLGANPRWRSQSPQSYH
jgi:hypothetical protein